MKGELKQEPQSRECHTSEEEESRSSGGLGGSTPTGTKRSKKGEGSGTEGASIEVGRRPRGRPPGSKNKPKPPIIITRESTEPSMHPHVLEVPGGLDVVDAIARFARRRNVGLCVLAGSGTVANVTLRQPSTAASGSTVTFHGRFDIVSISATFLPPSSSPSSAAVGDFNGFSISLAGTQGQIVGGFVVGPLLAAATVVVVAAAFNSPSFHRLPLEDDVSAALVCSSSAADAAVVEATPTSHQHAHHGAVESIYGSHLLPSQHHRVIWAPTPARQSLPPPPPPPY
ncbi:hypothetical protein AAC387_Pa11g1411 [Persea americana]